MTKRMLIDAAHPEETRVVIVDGSRVDELDFESRHKRQIRGNVYLAKVTRVEPSLQAAFIDYGGNKHGFLAFSEIHPDYYQIPYEDKLALQQQDEEALSKDTDDDDVEEDENLDPDEDDASDENDAEVADEQVKVASQRRKQMRRRRYKIQEVIKRGQVLLVQAVKEERGNKGAAMTTYLSLAGRYCVLMPNTPRGGGISRKIPNGADRKRLKSIMDELSVPQGMGVIVRTAGAKRTKAEITRDYSYLSRLWDEIRDTTLKSVAPNLIHEEGNLVKRSIRDLYNKDIEEVLVQGEDAYKNAKSFIKMLMPSHAKFVKRYDDEIPLFLRFNVESQIENSLDATVQLKSGGYLVIHPTEALVSVDVNSGRSTKERNVERTALKTNLEAAEELARQMRLRDLAGLIVVDFIDMDESKNNRSVENKMKTMLSRDRARIQTSRISQFGLMEISRQRRRRSLLEGSTATCSHCDGVGRKRTVESAALAAIRAVEEFAIRGKAKKIRLKCPPDVALYLLNEKRDLLTKVDENADVFTIVEHDDSLIRPAFTIEVAEKRSDSRKDPLTQIEKDLQEESKRSESDRAKAKATERDDEDDTEDDDSDSDTETTEARDTDARDEDGDSKPRRRRGRRGGRNRKKRPQDTESSDENSDDEDKTSNQDASEAKSDDSPKPRRRRRRRAPSKSGDTETTTESSDAVEQSSDKVEDKATPSKRRSSSRRKAPTKTGSASNAETKDDTVKGQSEDKPETEAPKPGRRRRAPSRNKASEDTDTKSDNTKPKPARRRAPAKAKTDSVETDAPVKEAAPKRRRAAPKRTDASAPEDKPKPRRRAPAKTAKADDAAATKPSTRRKAPAKAKPAADAVEEAPKPTRRRKAPAKATAAAKAPAKSDDTAGDAKPKPARKRAAPKAASKPASKAAPKKPAPKKPVPKKPVPKKEAPKADAAKAEADPQKAKPRARKAPTKPKPVDTPAPQAAPAPVQTAPAKPTESDDDAGARRRKAPPRRKRGLIDRLMGKE